MSTTRIPGVPTDGLKPSDLLWASLIDKPLLFPPSAHSHGSGDLPVNIAFKDQANTFTANQTVTGTITASGFASALKYQLSTATVYGTASVERMAVNDYDTNFGIKIQLGSSHKFTFSVDYPTGYWYSTEAKPRWGFRQYGTNEIGHGLVFSNAGVDLSLSGDYSANLNVRNSAGALTGINAGNVTASGTVTATEFTNPHGSASEFFGSVAGASASGPKNSGFGFAALQYSTSASNCAFGYYAANASTSNVFNVVVGERALLLAATLTSANVAIGAQAMGFTTAGNTNVAIGYIAAISAATMNDSVAIGAYSFNGNTTVTQSVAVGFQAGGASSVADVQCTFLGYYAAKHSSASGTLLTNATAIGANAKVAASNSLVLGAPGTNVGIGTTTPTRKLDISSTTGSTTDSTLRFSYFDTPSAYYNDITHVFSGIASLHLMQFSTTSNSVTVVGMTLTGQGRLGIGTSTPASTLDVAGTITANGTIIAPYIYAINSLAYTNGTNIYSPSDGIIHFRNSSNVINAALSCGSITTYQAGSGSGVTYGIHSTVNGGSNSYNVAGRFVSTNNSATRAIETVGDIYMTAGANLQMNSCGIIGAGNIDIAGVFGANGNVLVGDSTSSFATGIGGGIVFAGDTVAQGYVRASFAMVRGVKENSGYNNGLGALVFSTQADPSGTAALGTITEAMRITSGQRVLIGTTADDGASKLQVTGTVRVGEYIKSSVGDVTLWFRSDNECLLMNGSLSAWRSLSVGAMVVYGALSAMGHVTAGIQSLSTDPTGSDLASGQTRTIKNTSTGTTKVWLNDGGTFKSLTFV